MGSQLSMCATAMLTAIVSNDVLDTDQLMAIVPWNEPSVGCGEDLLRWFDDLQQLLDWALIVREPAPHAYLYQATPAGARHVYGLTVTQRMGTV